MAKAQKGSHKVEFFSNLALIRQRFDEGMVVAKLLYDELIAAGKITMPYQSFAKYFRNEIVGKPTISGSAPKEDIATVSVETPVNVQPPKEQNDLSQTEGEHEPVWGVVGGKKGKSYNPHTRPIDPDDVISIGKK